jgi:hypothetical protein
VAVKDPDELYGLPLERFVPERGALSRALRDAGNREQAARVAKLRKPSLAAWAVNQLMRTQRRAIEGLFKAGADAQRAQAELLAGDGDAESLRDASRRERAAVDELLQAAHGLLSSGGHELSPTMLERVADTLHAAALDTEARERAAGGRLERELRYVGMSAGMTAAATTVVTGAPEPTPSREAKRKQGQAEKAARKAETDARRAQERAERTLKDAQQRRDRAAEALDRAQEALDRAEEALAAAREAVEHARERSPKASR